MLARGTDRRIVRRMWEIRRFIAYFDKFLRDQRALDRFRGNAYRSTADPRGLFLFLLLEKRLFLKFGDRMRVRIANIRGLEKVFGKVRIDEDSVGRILKLKRYDWSLQSYRDIVSECEQKEYVRLGFQSIELLQPGRKLLRWTPFFNSIATEYSPLSNLLSIFGLGTAIGIVISNAKPIGEWLLKLVHG